ncbi:MAG: hypothetical protein EPO38_04040 [Rhizorhabdus sp.]|jgi:hypothetical protein|nr:MAG: hypothetical protein EPO38_04040 [Rhizorhabdus sp.]
MTDDEQQADDVMDKTVPNKTVPNKTVPKGKDEGKAEGRPCAVAADAKTGSAQIPHPAVPHPTKS